MQFWHANFWLFQSVVALLEAINILEISSISQI